MGRLIRDPRTAVRRRNPSRAFRRRRRDVVSRRESPMRPARARGLFLYVLYPDEDRAGTSTAARRAAGAGGRPRRRSGTRPRIMGRGVCHLTAHRQRNFSRQKRPVRASRANQTRFRLQNAVPFAMWHLGNQAAPAQVPTKSLTKARRGSGFSVPLRLREILARLRLPASLSSRSHSAEIRAFVLRRPIHPVATGERHESRVQAAVSAVAPHRGDAHGGHAIRPPARDGRLPPGTGSQPPHDREGPVKTVAWI